MKKLGCFILCLMALGFGQKQTRFSNTVKPILHMENGIESEDNVNPKRLSYQGLLTKSNGKPVLDDEYIVKFVLYPSLDGESSFWEESDTININDGLINTILGEKKPIESIPDQAFLEITINGEKLTPRQEMTSVFYAMLSDTARYSEGGDYDKLDNIPVLDVLKRFIE